jgi:hypothetical protein
MARRKDGAAAAPQRAVLGLLGLALVVAFFAGPSLGLSLESAATRVALALAGVLAILAALLWKRFPPFMQAFGTVLAWVVAALLILESGALLASAGDAGEGSGEAEGAGRFRTDWEPYLGSRTIPTGGWTHPPSRPSLRPVPGAAAEGEEAFEVWLLGGDMAWGGAVPDDSTPAAALQRELLARRSGPVRVVCAAQPGYVTTQELIRLSLAVRDGGRPDLVVCLHGYEDVLAAHSTSVAGDPLGMTEMRREESRKLSVADVLAAQTGIGRLLAGLLEDGDDGGIEARSGAMPVEVVAGRTARTALANQELMKAVCGTAGSRAAFFWQPTPWTAQAPLSAAESTLTLTAAEDPEALGELVTEVWDNLDSISASMPGTWMLDGALQGGGELFAGVSTLTGRGSSQVAAAMVDALAGAGLL